MYHDVQREIERLAREHPLSEQQARRFYGRLLATLWPDEKRVLREAYLEQLLVERRSRLGDD